MSAAITLRGTPVELGFQLATNLLEQPLHFAAEQLDPEELAMFCSSLLSATAGLIARKVGTERTALMASALADVTTAHATEARGPLQ